MKPLQHARISAHRFGGRWQDYMAVHDLLDASKAAFPSMQHRAVLHSADLGAAVARQILGPSVRNADGAEVAVQALAVQHVEDDLGWPCPAAAWIERLPALPGRRSPLPPWLARLADDPAGGLGRRWRCPPLVEPRRPTPTAFWPEKVRQTLGRHFAPPKQWRLALVATRA